MIGGSPETATRLRLAHPGNFSAGKSTATEWRNCQGKRLWVRELAPALKTPASQLRYRCCDLHLYGQTHQ